VACSICGRLVWIAAVNDHPAAADVREQSAAATVRSPAYPHPGERTLRVSGVARSRRVIGWASLVWTRCQFRMGRRSITRPAVTETPCPAGTRGITQRRRHHLRGRNRAVRRAPSWACSRPGSRLPATGHRRREELNRHPLAWGIHADV